MDGQGDCRVYTPKSVTGMCTAMLSRCHALHCLIIVSRHAPPKLLILRG